LFSSRPLVVLRGLTGSGKTDVLHELRPLGVQVLDLEGLAGHRGSAFGGLGLPPQPTHHEFQRRLADAWHAFATDRVVVCEQEAAYLGSVSIPDALQRRIADAPWIELVATFDARVARTLHLHAGVSRDELVAAVGRLAARLGADAAVRAQASITGGDLRAAVAMLLPYYDAAYTHQLARLSAPIGVIDVADVPDAAARVARILGDCGHAG
jgi:tRNA 2-selenouridine synthase